MKYELQLDETEARALVYDLSNDGSDLEKTVADQLASQLPPSLPVPTKVGAVVKTEHRTLGGYYLRWAHDNATTSPWVQVGNHEEPYRTDEIGCITEVLSEGVDL